MDITDWLGHVGGTPEILRIFIGFFVGAYVKFYSSLNKIKRLYKLKS